MESFQEKIQQRLLKQEQDGLELGQTISSMRVVSDDFQQYLDTIEQEDSNDSFELF
jgi:hypothetical protein